MIDNNIVCNSITMRARGGPWFAMWSLEKRVVHERVRNLKICGHEDRKKKKRAYTCTGKDETELSNAEYNVTEHSFYEHLLSAILSVKWHKSMLEQRFRVSLWLKNMLEQLF